MTEMKPGVTDQVLEDDDLEMQSAEEYREYAEIMGLLRRLVVRSRPRVKDIIRMRAPMDAQIVSRT